MTRGKKAPATVVVVDDDPEMISAIQRDLRDEPFEVLGTDDPFKALEWLRAKPVEVVIADEYMPGMSGSDLLDAARRYAPRCATIVVTGYPEMTATSLAHQQKFDLVLAKPWDDGELRTSVRKLLDAKAAQSPRRAM